MTKKPHRLHWENYYENEPVSIEIMCHRCTETSHWLHKSLSIAFPSHKTPLPSSVFVCVCVAQDVIGVLTATRWLSLRLCILFGHCVFEEFTDQASCNSSASINSLNSRHRGQISNCHTILNKYLV